MRRWIAVGCFLIGTLLLWRTFAPRSPVVALLEPPALTTDAPAAVARVPMIVSGAATIATPLEPTIPPIVIPTLAGARPRGDDCPADHMVKGNIVDRGENKGDRIYHVVGSGSYAQTKPERCFVDVAEAELAGFRAPK